MFIEVYIVPRSISTLHGLYLLIITTALLDSYCFIHSLQARQTTEGFRATDCLIQDPTPSLSDSILLTTHYINIPVSYISVKRLKSSW